MASNVHVATQVLENYGAHDWDGTGECPQYWKPKFGDDYIIYNAPSIRAAAEYVQERFGRDDDYYREHVTFSSTDIDSLPEWKTPIKIKWADRHNEYGVAVASQLAMYQQHALSLHQRLVVGATDNNEAREELFDHYANV